MVYLDTSFLLSILLRERASGFALEWITRQPERLIGTSIWTGVEVASGLALNRRHNVIDDLQLEAAKSQLSHSKVDFLLDVPIRAQCFETAERFLSRFDTGLRSGDALHLAIAFHSGAGIATFDKKWLPQQRNSGSGLRHFNR